jgi:hypothetical protein
MSIISRAEIVREDTLLARMASPPSAHARTGCPRAWHSVFASGINASDLVKRPPRSSTPKNPSRAPAYVKSGFCQAEFALSEERENCQN